MKADKKFSDSMTRMVFAALAVVMILSGCRYNPLYDGQEFRLYSSEFGLFEKDGADVFIPVEYDKPLVIECYGGKGKSHSVVIQDPSLLDYSYSKTSVKYEILDDADIRPASVTLLPKKLGDTSITISDNDGGGSITVNVHICPAYKVLVVTDSHNCYDPGTVLAFKYGGVDDVVSFCKKNNPDGGSYHDNRPMDMEHIVDGKYRFVPSENTVILELSYETDSNGQPCRGGMMTDKRFKVKFSYGKDANDPEEMMKYLHLDDLKISTKVEEDPYDVIYLFSFIDMEDEQNTEISPERARRFTAWSASIIPWMF